MTFDVILLFLISAAFYTGFQKGVFRIFSIFLAIIFAFLCFLWIAPYIADFFFASVTSSHHYIYPWCLSALFLLLSLGTFRVIKVLWKYDTNHQNGWLTKMVGGVMMAALMLISVCILTTFLKRSAIMKEQDFAQSRTAQFLKPVEHLSHKLFERITAQTAMVKNRSKPG